MVKHEMIQYCVMTIGILASLQTYSHSANAIKVNSINILQDIGALSEVMTDSFKEKAAEPKVDLKPAGGSPSYILVPTILPIYIGDKGKQTPGTLSKD